jgi:hypothetical protein
VKRANQRYRCDTACLYRYAVETLKNRARGKTRQAMAYFYGRLATTFVRHGYEEGGIVATGKTRSGIIDYLKHERAVNRKRAYAYMAVFVEAGLASLRPDGTYDILVPPHMVFLADGEDMTTLPQALRRISALYESDPKRAVLAFGPRAVLGYLVLRRRAPYPDSIVTVDQLRESLTEREFETAMLSQRRYSYLEPAIRDEYKALTKPDDFLRDVTPANPELSRTEGIDP